MFGNDILVNKYKLNLNINNMTVLVIGRAFGILDLMANPYSIDKNSVR